MTSIPLKLAIWVYKVVTTIVLYGRAPAIALKLTVRILCSWASAILFSQVRDFCRTECYLTPSCSKAVVLNLGCTWGASKPPNA